jgi:hypothetical protein
MVALVASSILTASSASGRRCEGSSPPRGNHGHQLAFAGVRAGVAVAIVVSHGNSTEKNAAIRLLGAELIEHGRDFDEAKEQAVRIAAERGLEYAPSFHRDFIVGVGDLRARAVHGEVSARGRSLEVPVRHVHRQNRQNRQCRFLSPA